MELWSGKKPDISHFRVFGCQAWVHILKKRRHKLEPKSQEMIFVGYEPGSKGYQFWDTAHWQFEISHDVKFNETLFPAKEATNSQTSLNDLPIPLSDNESETLGGISHPTPLFSKTTQPRSICNPHPATLATCHWSKFSTFHTEWTTCTLNDPRPKIFIPPYKSMCRMHSSIFWKLSTRDND